MSSILEPSDRLTSGGLRRTVWVLAVLTFLAVPLSTFAIVPAAAVSILLVIVLTSMLFAVSVMGTALLTVVNPNELRGLCMGVFAAVSVLFGVGVAPVLVSRVSALMGGPEALGGALSSVSATETVAECNYASNRQTERARKSSMSPTLIDCAARGRVWFEEHMGATPGR